MKPAAPSKDFQVSNQLAAGAMATARAATSSRAPAMLRVTVVLPTSVKIIVYALYDIAGPCGSDPNADPDKQGPTGSPMRHARGWMQQASQQRTGHR